MPQLTKRACDGCISRKVKCDGTLPCRTCQGSLKRVQCTYLKPARKRGPKIRRPAARSVTGDPQEEEDISPRIRDLDLEVSLDWPLGDSPQAWTPIPKQILASIVRQYQNHSYNVWPIVDANHLIPKLDNVGHDKDTYCLVTALCAATMAQLELPPLRDGDWTVDSSMLAADCIRIREQNDYRESLDVRSILVSFFLHVYHAKMDRRNSAMMFIQEAISAARLLKLDSSPRHLQNQIGLEVVENCEILFPLIWVSERGYAMHLGLAPSYTDSVQLPELGSVAGNVHIRGLIELVRLFVTFDRISVRPRTGRMKQLLSAEGLAETESILSTLSLGRGNSASTRFADYYITREWMRTIIWQEALSMGLLSSTSYLELMTFDFPARVSRDLLLSLRDFSQLDLLPLGRDQLFKCSEVANSLADTVLLTPTASFRPTFQLGPQDFLHALYQKLLPFLEQDPTLKSILRAKTAEALVRAPARIWNMALDEPGTAEDEETIQGGLPLEESNCSMEEDLRIFSSSRHDIH